MEDLKTESKTLVSVLPIVDIMTRTTFKWSSDEVYQDARILLGKSSALELLVKVICYKSPPLFEDKF